MLGGIRDFIVISSPEAIGQIEDCLGDGSRWGIAFEYVVQPSPRGIADAFIVAEHQLAESNTALVLGDNIFYGTGFPNQIMEAMSKETGATIFSYEVIDSSEFGVVTVDNLGRPIAIQEKPKDSATNLAVPGLYFYDKQATTLAKQIVAARRGELEIADLNRAYMDKGELRVLPISRGTAWLDGGTPQSLFEAGQFVQVFENRTGLKIACPEEVAYRMRFITLDQLEATVSAKDRTAYANYIRALVQKERGRG
jgi:glucose-1-phosphate thymidylyltransferase